ncbi:MAG: hypothetical protein KME49_12345 [Brasilonema octagenarum HA4186-MV1]|nr:hypothetical protein [Brasilonema octagenarum HA4186-MV1]
MQRLQAKGVRTDKPIGHIRRCDRSWNVMVSFERQVRYASGVCPLGNRILLTARVAMLQQKAKPLRAIA